MIIEYNKLKLYKKGDILINKESIENAIKIYTEKIEKDFPEEEIPPLSVYEKCLKEGIFECYSFSTKIEEEIFKNIGYIVSRKVDDIIFIMVLAVDKNIRGKGLGKIMLNEFKDFVKNEKIIVLEAENPEEDNITEKEKIVREKRIKFYNDLGFKVTEKLKYILVGIDYKILYFCLDDNEKIIDANRVMNYMEKIYENVLRNRKWLEMEVIN